MRRRRRRRGGVGGLAIALAIVFAVLAVLALSPRHRHFYSRLFEASESPAPRAGPLPAQPPSGPPPMSGRPPGFAAPIGPGPSSAPQPAAPPESSAETPKQKALREKQAQAVAAVPRARLGEPVVVKILDDLSARLPLAGPPPAWELKEFAGRAQVDVVRDEERVAFRLQSERTSFALYRDVALEVKDYPLLSWTWKVVKLPAGGDIRERTSDDQAAQVYVIFPRWPFPRINSDVLGYIWDSRAPVGLKVTSPQSSNVKLVVLESGPERLGQWVREERNVYQDYVDLFGKKPPQAGKVAIMIDSNDTRSQAEAFFAELVFQPLKR